MRTVYGKGLRKREDDLVRILRSHPQREWEAELGSQFEDLVLGIESEFPELEDSGELSGAALADAVRANRESARKIGWGCVIGGRVIPIDPLNKLLGLGAGATEEEIARAVARWQRTQPGGRGDGKLGPQTWQLMKVLPPVKYRPMSWPVSFGGQQLGIIEKTRPYGRITSATNFGVEIELGFRVTDMDAVRKAGFVDKSGEDQFRWIQVIELRRIGPTGDPADTQVQAFRRQAGGRIIDPTSALLPLDRHPYYWYEQLPAGLDAGFHISNYLNRPGDNGLCYDLIFYDQPSIPLTAAQPGRRAYFNFETALVGVRPGSRNVILNTVLWGFDIIQKSGVSTLGVNTMEAGPRGGSAGFRQVLSKESAAGHFPGHCYVGTGYARAATCA